MNCLILVLLLLCCGNNEGCGNNWGGCFGNRPTPRSGGCSDSDRSNSGNCRERSNDDDCGCRKDSRPDSRFDQRPFMFGQNQDCDCGRDDSRDSRGCDCGFVR